MKPTKALDRLALAENEPLRWLFGKILIERAAQVDWDCLPLKFLEEGNQVSEKYWNKSIAEFRNSLVNPGDAPNKAELELNPAAKNFIESLDSFVAEIISIRYLRTKGFDRFKVVLKNGKTIPDFMAELGSEELPVEVKDLRLTASADSILDDIVTDRAGRRLNAALRNNSDKHLQEPQAEELRNWARNDLPLAPGDYEKELSDGSIVRIRIGAGDGDLRVERDVSFNFDTEDEYNGLRRKAIRVVETEVLRKESIVNSKASRKIVVMRWTVPPGCLLDMFTFPDRLEADLAATFKSKHPDFEFHIFTDWWTGEKGRR